MSGESGDRGSDWTIDTLREHVLALLLERDRRFDERIVRQQAEWHEHLEQARREVSAALAASEKAVLEVDRRHSEQFEASEKAVHAAFLAQQTAVKTALDAAEKAVEVRAGALDREFHEHLTQYRHEVTLAFEASDKAITKAELATERRFESVNEFRGQLADQATRFVPKAEFDGQVQALRTEQQSAAGRNAERIQELTNRVNRAEGKGAGLDKSWVLLLGLVAAVGTILTLYLALRGG